jgi:tetratricopeptide (TPR) repeat protein
MFWKRKKKEEGNGNGSYQSAAPAVVLTDLEIARMAFMQGDLSHAMSHVAWFLKDDPLHKEGRSLLNQLIQAAHDPLELVPFGEKETPYTIAMARAYIYVQQNRLEEALFLVDQVYRVVPGVPFLAWLPEWFTNLEQVLAVKPETMARFVGSLAEKIREAEEQQYVIEQLSLPLRHYQQVYAHDWQVTSMMSVFLRRMGRLEEATALAKSAYAIAPGYQTAVFLGGAYRANGDVAAAANAFIEAASYNPDDLAIRLDIGDTLCRIGELEAGVAAYKEVLAREPNHPWAKPSFLYYQYFLEPDGSWMEQLKHYAEANPDNQRAGFLRWRLVPYFAVLLEPADALINSLRQMSEQSFDAKEIKFTLSALESPSARLAVERYQIEKYGKAHLEIKVTRLQKPDPRVPKRSVDYLLWRYKGTNPEPAVQPASSQVNAAILELAQSRYSTEFWFHKAYPLASNLGVAAVNDLLGVMVHPPARPETFPIWAWIQRVQVAAAFVIGRLERGWEGSTRKSVLFSLARGPMDWTVEAAIIALAQIAFEEQAAAPDVAELYLELLNTLPDDGGIPYLDALLTCSTRLPSPPPALRRLVERMLNDRSQ